MCAVVFTLESARMYTIGAPLMTCLIDHRSLEGLSLKSFEDIDNNRLLRLLENSPY